MKHILVFDTETTGLPKNWKLPMSEINNWPRVMQLGWQLYTVEGKLVEEFAKLILPDGWTVPTGDFWKDHGYYQKRSENEGIPIKVALKIFSDQILKADLLVAHNISFDYNVLGAEFLRANMTTGKIIDKFCTKESTTDIVQILDNYGRFKWPTLMELYKHLFDSEFEGAHDALDDVKATSKCFFELLKLNLIPAPTIACLR